jgi:hypothetical protein
MAAWTQALTFGVASALHDSRFPPAFMHGITIGRPTVSRHLSSAAFPDCEKAGLAISDINANIE